MGMVIRFWHVMSAVMHSEAVQTYCIFNGLPGKAAKRYYFCFVWACGLKLQQCCVTVLLPFDAVCTLWLCMVRRLSSQLSGFITAGCKCSCHHQGLHKDGPVAALLHCTTNEARRDADERLPVQCSARTAGHQCSHPVLRPGICTVRK